MKSGRDGRPAEIVIPMEEAVFWMDGQGRWHNHHGPFEHKKIIDHFNAAIQKDEDGYFVGQSHDGIYEKVYFPYQDTALFVTDLFWDEPVQLLINTGKRMDLSPELLFIRDDQLFYQKGNEIIKFSQHALTKISEKIEFSESGCSIRLNGIAYSIPEGERG
jgi:hypothetical protein